MTDGLVIPSALRKKPGRSRPSCELRSVRNKKSAPFPFPGISSIAHKHLTIRAMVPPLSAVRPGSFLASHRNVVEPRYPLPAKP